MPQKISQIFCSLCHQTIDPSISLLEHYSRTHSDYITYSCKACKRAFPHIQALNQHLQSPKHQPSSLKTTKNDVKAIIQPQKSSQNLPSEKITISTILCVICNRNFGKLSSWQQHFKAAHNAKYEMMLTCPDCYRRVYSYNYQNKPGILCVYCQKIIDSPVPKIKTIKTRQLVKFGVIQHDVAPCPPHEWVTFDYEGREEVTIRCLKCGIFQHELK